MEQKAKEKEQMMEAIRKEVQKLCTGDGRVRIQETQKNNGVIKHGLVICEDTKSISPFIYLEPYLSMLKNGESTIKETAKTNQRNSENDLWCLSKSLWKKFRCSK